MVYGKLYGSCSTPNFKIKGDEYMANKIILSTHNVKKVHTTDEHIVDPDIPTGDSPEDVSKRWTYITKNYEGSNLAYRPSKGG